MPQLYFLYFYIFTEFALRPMQSTICDIGLLSVCVFVSVPSRKTQFPVDWRILLFKGLIANIGLQFLLKKIFAL